MVVSESCRFPLHILARIADRASILLGLRTMDLVANALISLMARGARFLKVTPCN